MPRRDRLAALFFVVLSLLLIASCIAPPTGAPSTPAATTHPGSTTALPTDTNGFAWWNDAVFYEVFVRSFYDSYYYGVFGEGMPDLNYKNPAVVKVSKMAD